MIWFSLIILGAFFAAWGGVVVLQRLELGHDRDPSVCRGCRYDRSGLAEEAACPECGSPPVPIKRRVTADVVVAAAFPALIMYILIAIALALIDFEGLQYAALPFLAVPFAIAVLISLMDEVGRTQRNAAVVSWCVSAAVVVLGVVAVASIFVGPPDPFSALAIFSVPILSPIAIGYGVLLGALALRWLDG